MDHQNVEARREERRADEERGVVQEEPLQGRVDYRAVQRDSPVQQEQFVSKRPRDNKPEDRDGGDVD